MRIQFRATTSGQADGGEQSQSFNLKWVKPSHVRVDECIYCGSKLDLSDEHSVPYSIWGNSKLVAGSCEECRLKIQPHEDYVFRYLWAKPREFYQAPTRKAKKERRWSGQSEITDDEGKIIDVPVAHALPLLLTPYYDFLPENLHTGEFGSGEKRISVVPLTNTGASIQRYTTDDIFVSHERFSRVCAKIAYGEYIRSHDKYFRSPSVSGFIVDGVGEAKNFCGAISGEPSDDRIHSLGYKIFRRRDANAPDRLACRLRLFSFLAVPTIFVDLGEISAKRVPQHLAVSMI
jgi:hypothetical protein